MSYEDYGSGPIALLIHGSPGNGKAWQRVGERLATHHRVIAPDLPGHGPTTPPPADSAPDPAYDVTGGVAEGAVTGGVGHLAAQIDQLLDPPHEVTGRQLRDRNLSVRHSVLRCPGACCLEVAHHAAALDLHSPISFRQAICAVA